VTKILTVAALAVALIAYFVWATIQNGRKSLKVLTPAGAGASFAESNRVPAGAVGLLRAGGVVEVVTGRARGFLATTRRYFILGVDGVVGLTEDSVTFADGQVLTFTVERGRQYHTNVVLGVSASFP